jgi:hypothetical protein
MENDQNTDPYEAVLADLRAQKERIDTTIALLESLRGAGVAAPPVSPARVAPTTQGKSKAGNRPDIGPGAFLGMSVADATKMLLHAYHRQMTTPEVVSELERGGVVMTSADKVNTVGSILLRRFYNVGDVVRVSRGVWGLQEWYPGRKFPGAKVKPENGEKGEGTAEAGDEAVGNEGGTNPDMFESGEPPEHVREANLGNNVDGLIG